jgi:predicted aminopeptidase
MVKKILLFVLIILAILIVWQYDMVAYGVGQAKGQFKILWQAKPLEHYLNDPDFPDSLKYKITLSQEIKDFANNNLGLKGEKNYNRMYDQQGKPVLWVVTAAPRFKLEAVQWRFPILGAFSYKGFFDLECAEEEAERLKEQDLDVDIGHANAWSTLGWFRDPLLSNLLYRSEGNLADVIIHELTHTTIFVKNDVEFNENLATFVGNKGAELFLIERYGKDSQQLTSYINSREDRRRFANHVLSGAEYLDSIYQHMDTLASYETNMGIRTAAINRFVQSIDTVTFINKSRYSGYFDNFTPDNTFFLAYTRYRAKLDDLEAIFYSEFNGDLREFIAYHKENLRSLQPPLLQ